MQNMKTCKKKRTHMHIHKYVYLHIYKKTYSIWGCCSPAISWYEWQYRDWLQTSSGLFWCVTAEAPCPGQLCLLEYTVVPIKTSQSGVLIPLVAGRLWMTSGMVSAMFQGLGLLVLVHICRYPSKMSHCAGGRVGENKGDGRILPNGPCHRERERDIYI